MAQKVVKSVTSQETWRGVFIWEIQEIDTLLRPECSTGSFGCLTSLTSRDFTAGHATPNESTWQITIRNQGTTGKYKVGECAAVNLNLIDAAVLTETDSLLTKKNFSITCAYTVQIGGTLEKPFLSKQHGRKFYIQRGGESTDIPLQELYDRRDEIFPSNNLIIKVELAINIGTTNQTEFTESRPLIQVEDPLNALADSLGKLLIDPSFSDVVIDCGQNKFLTHKIILSARSPVLQKLLFTDVDMSNPVNNIAIEDVKPELMMLALKFIYMGRVDFPQNEALLTELLACAEKFDLQGLKSACLLKMFESLNDDNAGSFAVAVHHYNADRELRCQVMDYCQRRHAVLIKNAEYKKLFLTVPDAFFNI